MKELIEILKTYKPNKGIISPLDVENLSPNVPVLETINIIINNIYHHPNLPPLKINSNTLRKILLLYTTQVSLNIYDDHLKKFPDIFRMGTFIDSTHMKL